MWLVSNLIILRINLIFSETYNIDEANRDRLGVVLIKSLSGDFVQVRHKPVSTATGAS